EIHHTGFDAQAICGWTGPGNYTITNNYLEATGENIMFGGDTPSITNLVPSNITITGNLFSKPMTWNQFDPAYGKVNYSIKNLFELKNAQTVLAEQNILDTH